MSRSTWTPLRRVLDAYAKAGRQPRFWLRDDDATEPGAALDELVDITLRHHVPLTLAVIPAGATAMLARSLAAARHVTPVVHGWAHENHAAPGEKKQELGLHRSIDLVLGDLDRGLRTIETIFGDQAYPMLVPPWNRIDHQLLPHLAAIGYQAVSVFGKPVVASLPVVNATVDIIDWHGSRGCRDHAVLAAEIIRQLEQGLHTSSTRPVGILTHHLVHDRSAWSFLADLFAITNQSAPASWLSTEDIVNQARPETRV